MRTLSGSPGPFNPSFLFSLKEVHSLRSLSPVCSLVLNLNDMSSASVVTPSGKARLMEWAPSNLSVPAAGKKPGHNGKYSKKRGEMECRSRVMMAIDIEQQLAQMDATSENGPRTSGDLFFLLRTQTGKGREGPVKIFSPFMSVFDCAATKKGGNVKVGYI